MTLGQIKKTIEIEASADSIFKALSDERELPKWWVDVPKLQLEVGGKLTFRFLKERSEKLEKDFVIEGKITEIIPNQKLSYTWKPIDDPEYPNTLVTWTLESINKNKTKVTVLHSGLEQVKGYTQLDDGWSYFINKLGDLFKTNF